MSVDTSIAALFLAAVLLRGATRLWLAGRQLAAVRARRSSVPPMFAGAITTADHEKAADYAAARMHSARVGAVTGAVVALALTFGGGVAAVDAAWRQTALAQPWLGTAVVLSVLALLQAVELPFAIWRTFGLESRFGFNRTSPRLFAADFVKRLAIGAVIVAPLAAAAIALMQHAGRWWWVAAWAGWLCATLALTWAWPRLVAPLFNRFAPLDDPVLETRIASLVRRCGFASDGVFVMDGSRRSARGNAYFTGVGRSKRIVFFDTLLARLGAAEVEAVLAHELGHFRLNHIRRRFIAASLSALAGFGLLAWLAARPGFYAALGVPIASEHAALLLFVILVPAFTFFATPVLSAWSRRHELEADDFAVRYTSADALSNALIKIYRDNGSNVAPDRLYSAFYDSHPPALERVARLKALTGGPAPARPGRPQPAVLQ
ncbi:MAG: M48 family metallopeptidase [Gammaproteobacteria bacterium]|nr:M48 family metallopeptidase [Gammaproteobacteria bacterium]